MLQTTNRKNDINALLINPILFLTRIGITHYKRAVLTQEVTDPKKNMRKLLGKNRYQTTQVLQFLITGSRCLQRSVSTKQQASICKFDTCRDP